MNTYYYLQHVSDVTKISPAQETGPTCRTCPIIATRVLTITHLHNRGESEKVDTVDSYGEMKINNHQLLYEIDQHQWCGDEERTTGSAVLLFTLKMVLTSCRNIS